MKILLLTLLFSLGTCFGSFLLLIGMRLPEKRPIALARSQCAHCQRNLQVVDLIPLLSFLLLRGQCRYCQKKISPSHFWFELAAGVILLVLQQNYSQEPAAFLYQSLVYTVLFLMAAVDVHYLYFPDRFQLILLLLLLSDAGSNATRDWTLTLLNGAGLLVILFLTERISPEGLGGGDKKLLLTFALTVGLRSTLTVLFWASLGCLAAFLLRSLKDRIVSPHPLPFGPFLAAAFFLLQEGFLNGGR